MNFHATVAMDDNYSASDFDSCMVAAANQQRDVNSQSQAEQVQTQDDHDKQQQQTDQTHQITQQVQPVTPSNMPLTPIRLPAILDGEFFTVTKVEDSNVTVRCSYCQRFLNGNLKSTGNFLSHIKVSRSACTIKKVYLCVQFSLLLRSSQRCYFPYSVCIRF